ncbi:MAG: FixH family protein [Mangrovicoccus sp.]
MAPLTGKKVLAICVAAFGVIIGVNLILAWQAVATFPGVEVKNSFVASQEFDKARAAQLGLGWDVAAEYGDGVLEIIFTDSEGAPVKVAEMTALVGWATSTRDDVTPEFTQKDGVFATPLELTDGNWNIRLQAFSPEGVEFRQRIPLFVKNGAGY